MKRWFFEAIRALWISIKSGLQIVRGVYRLSRLSQPIVSVFGGRGAYEGGKYAEMASDLSRRCAKEGMSVITGGGPGIMEAANCGAYEEAKDKKRATLGIGVTGVDDDFVNPCASVIKVENFFARKWLLTRYSCGFVLFPGGVGTMNELFEVLDLIKLRKMKRVPVILIGSSYWKDLIEWYQHAYEYEFITLPLVSAFIITDDVSEAMQVLLNWCPEEPTTDK